MNKLAVLVVLLEEGENFEDLEVENVMFRSHETVFTLQRQTGRVKCNIALMGESNTQQI